MLDFLVTVKDNWLSAILILFSIAMTLTFMVFRKSANNKETFKVSNPLALILTVFVIFILVVVVSFLDNFADYPFATTVDDWGSVGDFFGGMLNPVFAFASFIALLYTIRIQREELTLTRDELKETRRELAATAKAQTLSSEILQLQSFESTFFSQIEYVLKLQSKFQSSKDFAKKKFLELAGQANYQKLPEIAASAIINNSGARLYYSSLIELIIYISEYSQNPRCQARLPLYYSHLSNMIDASDCYFLASAGSYSAVNRMSIDRYIETCNIYGLFRNSELSRSSDHVYVHVSSWPHECKLDISELGFLEHAFSN